MPRTAAPPFALWLLVVVAPAALAADPPYRDPEITAKDRRHWSFVPPTRPSVPNVARAGWVRNPIDAFVLAKLDAERPQAWRYRDYVIRSLNADKPFDRFVREQVAGDLLAAGEDPRDEPDLWIATGLHRCGQVHVVGGNVDKDENRQEVLTEMV